jgi:predicted Na+-dependent transporter
MFSGLIDPERAPEYIAGLILLGAAPCTAMVFVWSQLTNGDPNYTLVQVSVNDLIMVVAFAPIVALLLGVTDISVPWETLILSAVLYIVIPLVAGALTRRVLIARGGSGAVLDFTARIKPASVIGLLLTVVLLFGSPMASSRSAISGPGHGGCRTTSPLPAPSSERRTSSSSRWRLRSVFSVSIPVRHWRQWSASLSRCR